MKEPDWEDPELRTLGLLLLGKATDEVDERGRALYGETLLLLLNGGSRSRLHALPTPEAGGVWEELLNTARPGHRFVRQPTVNLTSHSLILLRENHRPRT
jgi:hypothetical protein